MKTASRLLIACVSAWGASAAFALDFTPRQETQMIDTYPIHFLSFPDGAQRVAYGPPTGWKATGSGSRLTLDDSNGQGQAYFQVCPIPKPASFNADTLKNLKAAALKLVPSETQNVTIAESTGQHLIANGEFYTADLTYAFYGQKFCLRVTFINLGKEYLEIVSTAPAKQFQTFSQALEGSLCSWHWMDAQ
ncbi:MAG: hypothetical protein ABIT76_07080 [Chthoniobacterales bacterium]